MSSIKTFKTFEDLIPKVFEIYQLIGSSGGHRVLQSHIQWIDVASRVDVNANGWLTPGPDLVNFVYDVKPLGPTPT